MIKKNFLKGMIFPALILSSFSANPQQLTKDVHASLVASGSNQFNTDLYGHLKKEPGNTLYSPYSIYTALSMPYAGARGITEKELSQVLHATLAPDEFHHALARVKDALYAGQMGEACELHVANKIFVQEQSPILQSFADTITNDYEGHFERVDFGEREATADLINQWVAQATNDKISTMVLPSYLSAATTMAIVNAIYFKGKWEKPFKKLYSQKTPFYVDRQNLISVDTMFQSNRFNYMENDELQMIELPYKESTLSMFVLLPRTTDGLAELESVLAPAKLATWQSQLANQSVMVRLPKFKLESTYMLEAALATMGMPSAFGCADFSGIDGSKSLSISRVIHKACIEVAEAGTEAAGSTAVIMGRGLSSFCKVPQATIFDADHPFIFIIKDKATGITLFMGRVIDPVGH